MADPAPAIWIIGPDDAARPEDVVRLGEQLDAVWTPLEGLERLADLAVDVLVVAPAAGGALDLATVHALRRVAPRTPLVAFARELGPETELEGLRLGADEVLPLDLPDTSAGADRLGRALARARVRRELNERAAASSAEREQFASIVSHDLQEPLRGVARYAHLLRLHLEGTRDPSVQQYLARVIESSERMSAMVKALLGYARLGSRPIERQPVDTETVVKRALENLKVAIDESAAVIEYEALPTVQADGLLLLQLVQNLLGNAIKFRGDAPPRISIHCEQCGDEWRFAVRDEGIGIDPEHAAAVFEIFRRLNPGTRPGTGVGLAIAQRIAERHGGRIWLESEPGVGSTFRFSIPVFAD
jgi:signal transduction histidine kinase